MEIIPIAEYISKKKDVALKRKRLARHLKANKAFLSRKLDGRKIKSRHKPERVFFRISEDTAQIRLILKKKSLEVAPGKYAFRVAASKGQNIAEAVIEALKVLRRQVMDGEYDHAIGKVIAATKTDKLVRKTQDKLTKKHKGRNGLASDGDHMALAV